MRVVSFLHATWLGLPSVGRCGIPIHSLDLLPTRGAVSGAAAGPTTPGAATSPGQRRPTLSLHSSLLPSVTAWGCGLNPKHLLQPLGPSSPLIGETGGNIGGFNILTCSSIRNMPQHASILSCNSVAGFL